MIYGKLRLVISDFNQHISFHNCHLLLGSLHKSGFVKCNNVMEMPLNIRGQNFKKMLWRGWGGGGGRAVAPLSAKTSDISNLPPQRHNLLG